MKKNIEASAEQLFRIINQLIFNEKNNILVYGDNLKLFPSEIHLILMITNGKFENYNKIVQQLGVTKGAVSQTISRLVKKGILEKKKNLKNNDLTILLTDAGKKVYKQCKKIQESMLNQFSSYLISLPENDRRIIDEFLHHIETTLYHYKPECKTR
jgi:DNA-binding MarR family transcriptional regulator